MSTLGGCALMNAWAAFFAALSRLGATSVAAMLPDTSMAMMTVPLAWDTGTVAAGPAVAASKAGCTGAAAGQGTQTYFVSADPSQVGNGYGTRHFATITSVSIYESTAKIAVFYSGKPPAPAAPLK